MQKRYGSNINGFYILLCYLIDKYRRCSFRSVLLRLVCISFVCLLLLFLFYFCTQFYLPNSHDANIRLFISFCNCLCCCCCYGSQLDCISFKIFKPTVDIDIQSDKLLSYGGKFQSNKIWIIRHTHTHIQSHQFLHRNIPIFI